MTYTNVLEELTKQRIVEDNVSFAFLARLRGLDKKLISGRYLLKSKMNNWEAITTLLKESSDVTKITFSHVRLIEDLPSKITSSVGVSEIEFTTALDEFVKSNKEGYTKDNILCMFIPNTYEVYFNIAPDKLIERLNLESKKFWNEDRKSKAKKLGLSQIEVSILASIVQAESIKSEESPIIAGLYLNRLKKRIPLQADPTLIFASGDFSAKRVLNDHKKIDSPYNTYLNYGLPPGPIQLPQISSIDAVLNYQPSDYLYMCARSDFSGYHVFSSDLRTHQNNARKYRKALTIEQQKRLQHDKK